GLRVFPGHHSHVRRARCGPNPRRLSLLGALPARQSPKQHRRGRRVVRPAHGPSRPARLRRSGAHRPEPPPPRPRLEFVPFGVTAHLAVHTHPRYTPSMHVHAAPSPTGADRTTSV